MADLVIRDGTLIDGTGSPPKTDITIVVQDGFVQEIGNEIAVEGRNEINADGQWIVPGFVDVHMHFQEAGGLYTRPDLYDLTEHFPFEREKEEITNNIRSTLAQHLCAGVTTAIEVGGPGWSFEVRELARSIDKAPHVYVAGPFIGFGDLEETWSEEDPSLTVVSSPDEVASAIRDILEKQPDLIKIGYWDGSLDTFGAVAQAATETAHQAGLPVYVHAWDLEAAKKAVLAGSNTLVHSMYFEDIDDDFIKLAKESDVIYAATAKLFDGYYEVLTQQRELLPIEEKCGNPRSIDSWNDLASIENPPPIPPLVTKGHEAREHNLDNLTKVYQAGIRIATGSDAGNIGTLHGASLHREFQAMAEAGMTPMDIIVAATGNGAQTLTENPDFGTIEPGKRADLVILNANPLDDIANAQNIDRVIRSGIGFAQSELTD